MPQTSLGCVSNSASKAFTNAKGNMALVNYGKIYGSQNQYDFDSQNKNNQLTNTTNNINSKRSNLSVWSGKYSENIIY